MDWPTAAVAATVGGGAVAAVFQAIKQKPSEGENDVASAVAKNLRDDSEDRRLLLKELVKTHQDNTMILKELALITKHRETRTEELHKSTHAKLGEITDNQIKIHDAILDGLKDLRLRAS
jgi:hypothetical protein